MTADLNVPRVAMITGVSNGVGKRRQSYSPNAATTSDSPTTRTTVRHVILSPGVRSSAEDARRHTSISASQTSLRRY